MATVLHLVPSPTTRAACRAPSILDLLRRGDLLDSDIDTAVDAYMADPRLQSCLLHSLYRVDFAEISAATRMSANCSPHAGERDDRQALLCALLLHRPHLVQPSAAEPRN